MYQNKYNIHNLFYSLIKTISNMVISYPKPYLNSKAESALIQVKHLHLEQVHHLSFIFHSFFLSYLFANTFRSQLFMRKRTKLQLLFILNKNDGKK